MPLSFLRRRSLWILLAALLGMGVAASLGVWQLGRAQQKTALFEQRLQRESLPAVGWSEIQGAPAGDLSAWMDRRVQLRGRWMAPATVFLDNRPMAGRSGFYVVTPFLPEGGGPAVLVQRGWAPRNFQDRSALPDVPTPEGVVDLEGWMAPPPSKLYEFAAAERSAIRQNVDLAAFAQEWSVPLLNASVLQSGMAGPLPSDGLSREWPRVGADVHKHHGYAFQWFGLSFLMAVLYVWFQIIVPRRRNV